MADQMISKALELTSVGLLSAFVPLAIFAGRNNIRTFRQELVRDLETLFDFAKKDGSALIIPSFELVKYKYDRDANPYNETRSQSQSPLHYFLSVFIYIVISFLGFYVSFSSECLEFKNFFVTGGIYSDQNNLFLATISYTFLGAYCWTLNYLLRRISNFDLSPLSFLRCTWHMLLAIFVAAVAWHQGNQLFPSSQGQTEIHTSLALAFLIGFYPLLMLDRLVTRYSWMRLKRVSGFTRALQEEIPLDTILGIDAFIKFRLSEFEIEDVQNLATTNPIQLFVETPYGLYEIIDWVAQAQLILAVGSEATAKLRKVNIRTIFDLEKALDNDALKSLLASILIKEFEKKLCLDKNKKDSPEKKDRGFEGKGNSEVKLDLNDLVEAIVAIIRDDLHVKRLRQIWDTIKTKVDDRPAKSGESS